MSQLSVENYFGKTKKRSANDDLLPHKTKILKLDQEITQQAHVSRNLESPSSLTPVLEEDNDLKSTHPSDKISHVPKTRSVVRNIQFDSPKGSTDCPKKATTRKPRTRKVSTEEGQSDIRDTFQKMGESKIVPFEKKGTLSPTKRMATQSEAKTPPKNEAFTIENEQPACGSVTPKKAPNLSTMMNKTSKIKEIERRLKLALQNKSKPSRLVDIRAVIDELNNSDKLRKLEHSASSDALESLKKDIEFEIPVSPQKVCRSPSKLLLSPMKNTVVSKTASPQRRILDTPKELVPSSVKSSPVKQPAWQKYISLTDKDSLPLPYSYRHLAEVFGSIETVVAMLFNRKETITFTKLKPAVQEMLRRNLTFDHLAQIKAVYPEAYEFRMEKCRNFGSPSKHEKFDLVLVPNVPEKSGRNTPDADNVLKSASETSMCPGVLLERKRIFYSLLKQRVKTKHEEFLDSLDDSFKDQRENIKRWHPDFNVESCPAIEKAQLPQPPEKEKLSAQSILDKAKVMYNCNTRMERALKHLEETEMKSKSSQTNESDIVKKDDDSNVKEVDISVVDTPPNTPTTEIKHLDRLFKGIPKNLLEKVRQRQAAKALEAMTRPVGANKEIAKYARLPKMAPILRNIFVIEKKNVLALEFVLNKLDNSYRTKLTMSELEEHVRLICKLVPTWASIHLVRKIHYLKLAKIIEMSEIIKRLETEANDKAPSY